MEQIGKISIHFIDFQYVKIALAHVLRFTLILRSALTVVLSPIITLLLHSVHDG